MRNTVRILNIPIDIVTLESALAKVVDLMEQPGCSMIATPNAEIVMTASEDADLKNILAESALCVPDGIGLIYASKIHGLGLTERVTGVDLMKRILEYCHQHNKSIYLLGGKPGVPQAACHHIKETFSGIDIKGYRDGYFKKEDEAGLIEEINELAPDVLFVALGAPKQEKWIHTYKQELKVKIAMGVGGSIDIWAGTVKRAPVFYQRMGLEWFYRLMKEPWRYKRMLALPKFMLKVLFSKKSV